MNDLPSSPLVRHAATEPDIDYLDRFPPADAADAPTVDHVDLTADPFADDLHDELAAAAPKRWHNRATYVLAALALLVGGFLAGVQVEKSYGSGSAANSRNAALGALANGFGGRGFGQGGGFGGRGGANPSASPSAPAVAPLTGKITLVDGTTVYVTLASGDVLTVRTTAATKVSVGTATKVSQLKAGETVTVTGPADSSGNVMASSITSGS